MSSTDRSAAVVLAAGEGTRMRSGTPKVLHPLCGRPMVLHVVDALAALPLERIVVVVGHGAERVTKTLHEQLVTEVPVEFVEQRVQRGTGDAVSVALTSSASTTSTPRTTSSWCPATTRCCGPRPSPGSPPSTATRRPRPRSSPPPPPTPTGYGRVVRDKDGRVARIVEHADADREEREINEINTSIYCFRRNLLAPALRRLSPENAQGEYYLTDAIEVLRDAGPQRDRARGRRSGRGDQVNDRVQLADAEAELRRRINRRLDARGRHDGRPAAHLHRRDGRARARRAAAARARCSRAAR